MSYRLGFVMEQTLGHVTHARNLQQWIAKDRDVIPTWIPVSFDARDRWNNMPLIRSNWTLRASLRAREQVLAALESTKLDGLFFHTCVTAILSRGLMSRIPTVVSMDATPINFDTIGNPYDHRPSRFRPLESAKNAINRRGFSRAARLVTWCDWAKQSLVRDYGVDEDKVEVIPPGVDVDRWKPVYADDCRPVRLLFVGGDFRRKGGYTVLDAFRSSLQQDCELDIVTREQVDTGGLPGVRVHHGLGPNSEELMALYAKAHVFVFPTLADVLPLAIMEAMASGLPVITTAVGGMREQVQNGVTGFLVPPGDPNALAKTTLRLVKDFGLRRTMSKAARQCAEQMYNASINYKRLLEVCKATVDAARL